MQAPVPRDGRLHRPPTGCARKYLVATFLADDGTTWTSWDGWNDDIGWMANATLRGYQITGNTSWLNVAETQWNNAYNRGWTPAGGLVPGNDQWLPVQNADGTAVQLGLQRHRGTELDRVLQWHAA